MIRLIRTQVHTSGRREYVYRVMEGARAGQCLLVSPDARPSMTSGVGACKIDRMAVYASTVRGRVLDWTPLLTCNSGDDVEAAIRVWLQAQEEAD